ncbi:MAG TPA: 6-phosphogluconolactonase [Candidatus Saccharimonadales bacterium]|nr:6-phosphogluconolactonase [Candidatus Saccharimonadales bacterium]
MFDAIEALFKKQNILSHKNQGIEVATVSNAQAGVDLATQLLDELVDRKTVIYLSGGSYKSLYERIAKDENLLPGAVGLIDERFGQPLHDNSNELMIKQTGLTRYLQIRDIPFYSVLQVDKDRIEVAQMYDEKVRSLQAIFPKHIGFLGIGPDGHISSIIPNRADFHNPWFDKERNNLLVSEFDDPKSHYKERVGMTFLGLSMLDFILIMAFGENKQVTLELVFGEGSEEDIPARFFKRPEIAKKTLLITDQKV